MNAEMIVAKKIKEVWKGVESAHSRDFLYNHEMLVFAFYKALMDMLEHVPAIYDGRQSSGSISRSNFFILSEDEAPVVAFIGKIRFEPSNIYEIKRDLTVLMQSIRKSEIDVLIDARNRAETRMQVSQKTEFGYLVLSDMISKSVEREIHVGLTENERYRFHFAYGPICRKRKRPNKFQYTPPRLVAQPWT